MDVSEDVGNMVSRKRLVKEILPPIKISQFGGEQTAWLRIYIEIDMKKCT